MLNLIPCFKYQKQKHSNIRVLRSKAEYLLIGVIQKNLTTIHILQSDSTSVMVFKALHNMDVINASVSSDNTLLHVSEKVITKNHEIVYRSRIFDLQGNSIHYENVSKYPIDGIFVNTSSNINFLYFNEETLSFANVEIINQKISITKIKYYNSVVWFRYDETSDILSIIYFSKFSYFLSQLRFGLSEVSSTKILLHPKAKLPNEISLIPTFSAMIPLYRVSNYIIYNYTKDQTQYIIQQLFMGSDSNLAFQISSFPHVFNQTVTISNTAPDIPICSMQCESLIFVWAPNSFITVIDITNDIPIISTLSKIFSTSICGQCATPIIEHNCIIDLDSSEIYNVVLSFEFPQFYLKSIDSRVIYTFATICTRLSNIEYISSILHIFELADDYSMAMCFFRNLFEICQGQYSMTKSSKSHSSLIGYNKMTRANSSFTSINSLLKQNKPNEDSPHKRTPSYSNSELPDNEKIYSSPYQAAPGSFKDLRLAAQKGASIPKSISSKNAIFSIFKQQNNMMLNIRSAIDQWIVKYHPTQNWQMTVICSVQSESVYYNFPSFLQEDTESFSRKYFSYSMVEFLNGTMLRKNIRSSEKDQLDYWRRRIVFNSVPE